MVFLPACTILGLPRETSHCAPPQRNMSRAMPPKIPKNVWITRLIISLILVVPSGLGKVVEEAGVEAVWPEAGACAGGV